MRLYTNIGTGEWFGTQADSRKGGGASDPVEVPTSKADLIAFLSEHKVRPTDRLCMEAVTTVVDDARIVEATTATHQSSTPVSLFEAAKGASLSDLQHVVYRYLEKIDDELDLRRST